MGVNCLPPRRVAACLPLLADAGLPFAVWANLGAPAADGGARSDDCTPDELAAEASAWMRSGARLVGGCCGTRPEHVRALRYAIDRTRPTNGERPDRLLAQARGEG